MILKVDYTKKIIEEYYHYESKNKGTDKKDFDKGLARAIVNRWNQQLGNETEEAFKGRVGEFWIKKGK